MNIKRLDWDELRLFLAVARHGTLTAAAEKLLLSQPTAGRKLRHLEEVCGVSLFQRTSKGFLLTDEGEAMLVHAERMEEEAFSLERHFSGNEQQLEGVLRLTSSDFLVQNILAEPVARFSLQHPQLSIEMITASHSMSLERREIDLAFRFVPFTGANIVQKRFVRIRYELFASRDYIQRTGLSGSKPDNSTHPLIMMDSQYDDYADVKWLRENFPKGHAGVRSNSRDVQAIACAQGAGLAVLPVVLGAKYGLKAIPCNTPPPSKDIYMGYHADLKRLRRLRLLIEYLSDMVAKVI